MKQRELKTVRKQFKFTPATAQKLKDLVENVDKYYSETDVVTDLINQSHARRVK